MYFDRSPLYSQRIITYKNWSTLRQSEFHKPIIKTTYLKYITKLYNFFLWETADFSNLFWFGKKMNENSQTKRKKICVTYMWQNFSLQKILSINCKRWCQVCQPSFLLLLFCIIYLKSGHWREQADVEESLKREFSILFCDLTKGFWK